MLKIASPLELRAELSALLDYARSPTPSRVRIARKLEELSQRVAGGATMDEAYLSEVAQLFAKVVVKGRFIMGTPRVKETPGHGLYLECRFQPYSESGVDALYVWVKDGHKVQVQMAGQYVPVGGDVESQGFGQRSVDKKFEFKGEPVARFVQTLGKLTSEMD